MKVFLKRLGATIVIIVVIGGVFVSGAYLGSHYSTVLAGNGSAPSILKNAEKGKPQSVDFSPFWRAWDILNQKYVPTHGTATTTNEDRVYGAIKGLAASYGDPYTTFFPPQEQKQFNEEISGNFEGIGVELGMKDSILTVIAPLKDTPAYKAGMLAGDKIVKINGTSTMDMTVDDAVSLIRGPRGTPVTLTILHENGKSPIDITINRAVINVPTIDTKLRLDGIFVISLYNFSENSPTLFKNALRQFVESHSNKMILDLRGNPGGYLEAAVDMASWFLPSDKVVVREDSGGHGAAVNYKSRGYNIFNPGNLKMVILVDGGSASASEIMAGALQEYGVATLIGEKTFGKGSVQELVPITDDTSLKVTIARWLTPHGISISEQGLKPDITVKMTQDDADKKQDPQMDRAVQFLLNQ